MIWLSIAVVFILAGVVKGVVGLGLPTMSMALLALWIPPMQAAALLVLPSLVTNIWQIRPWSRSIPMWRRLARMQVGVAAGTVAGGFALGAPGGVWAGASLGTALVPYSAWGLSRASTSVSPRHESWLGPFGVARPAPRYTSVYRLTARTRRTGNVRSIKSSC